MNPCVITDKNHIFQLQIRCKLVVPNLFQTFFVVRLETGVNVGTFGERRTAGMWGIVTKTWKLI